MMTGPPKKRAGAGSLETDRARVPPSTKRSARRRRRKAALKQLNWEVDDDSGLSERGIPFYAFHHGVENKSCQQQKYLGFCNNGNRQRYFSDGLISDWLFKRGRPERIRAHLRKREKDSWLVKTVVTAIKEICSRPLNGVKVTSLQEERREMRLAITGDNQNKTFFRRLRNHPLFALVSLLKTAAL